MDGVDDLGNVFLVVAVDKLKDEELWKTDFSHGREEVVDVVGVAILQFLALLETDEKRILRPVL